VAKLRLSAIARPAAARRALVNDNVARTPALELRDPARTSGYVAIKAGTNFDALTQDQKGIYWDLSNDLAPGKSVTIHAKSCPENQQTDVHSASQRGDLIDAD
jgi:hypothetical protein